MAVLLGHTLGTPAHTPTAALDLFARAGLDGAELIWLDDYPPAIPERDDGSVARMVRDHARALGLQIVCLTPYVTDLNSLDDATRERDLERMRRAIAVAGQLGARRMRVYGGALLPSDPPEETPRKWERMVESLRLLAPIASDHGVILCVENHFSTMTVSAKDTVRMVQDVGEPSVGILYDQANLTFTHEEDYPEAITHQAPWIRHVHVKDLEFIDPNRVLATGSVASIDKKDRVHMSRMIGDGILDWQAIVDALRATGYDGSYSLEYEYRWNPEDLPDPSVGFPESARRLRALFERAAASDPARTRIDARTARRPPA